MHKNTPTSFTFGTVFVFLLLLLLPSKKETRQKQIHNKTSLHYYHHQREAGKPLFLLYYLFYLLKKVSKTPQVFCCNIISTNLEKEEERVDSAAMTANITTDSGAREKGDGQHTHTNDGRWRAQVQGRRAEAVVLFITVSIYFLGGFAARGMDWDKEKE